MDAQDAPAIDLDIWQWTPQQFLMRLPEDSEWAQGALWESSDFAEGGRLPGLANKAMAFDVHLYSQRKQHLQIIVTINTKENKGENL